MEARGEVKGVNVNPATGLFSDGAAAVVLCNSLALASRDRDTPGGGKGVYAVRDWWSGVTPGTSEEITYRPTGKRDSWWDCRGISPD